MVVLGMFSLAIYKFSDFLVLFIDLGSSNRGTGITETKAMGNNRGTVVIVGALTEEAVVRTEVDGIAVARTRITGVVIIRTTGVAIGVVITDI